jgi:hypothetical protein
LVRLAHVGRGLDGGDELESDVSETDEADEGAGNDAQDVVVQQDGTDEDVDCGGKRLATCRDTFFEVGDSITYKHHGPGRRRGKTHSDKRGPGR